jgi:TatD DNase family protein
MLIDTHAHLDLKEYTPDLDAVLERAGEAGVGHIVSVSTAPDSLQRNMTITAGHRNVSTTVGLHPHQAGEFTEESWGEIERQAANPRVVGIGETGLDYYRDYAPRESQAEVFLRHIDGAGTSTLDILRREKAFEIGGVMHCFSGDDAAARRVLELGFFISIAGPLTYPRSSLAEVVRKIPVEYLVLETDAPYLAPQAHRGRRNEPAYLSETARALAPLKNLSEEDIRRTTTFNARALFRFPGAAAGGKIAYRIRDSLYLNVTNRCTNRCSFCGRETRPVVKGHDLRLEKEPTVQEILHAAGDVSPYREVVFCGYGEPLLRWEVVKEAAAALKGQGARVRINTNGQARLFLGKDILPEMAGLVDALSVSLIASDAAQYQKLCLPEGGAGAFGAVKDFIRDARRHVPEVTATVVGVPGLDLERCRRLATEELGADFRIRTYNEVG